MPSIRASGVMAKHHESMFTTDKPKWRTLMSMYGLTGLVLTALVGVKLVWPNSIELSSGLSDSLAAALALLASIFFGLSLTILNKAIDMDHSRLQPSLHTERAAKRLQALAANTLFTAFLAGVATILLIVGRIIPVMAEYTTIFATATVFLVGTNGILTANRIFQEIKWRTNLARTGESYRRDKSTIIAAENDISTLS